MILTKNEIDDSENEVWTKILGKSGYSPADGDIFNKLFIYNYLIIIYRHLIQETGRFVFWIILCENTRCRDA